MYHILMLPSNISMQVHTKHLPTRITIHSDLHLFFHTVHLDLYNISLKCHLPGLQSETGIREGMNTVTLQPPVKFALPWRESKQFTELRGFSLIHQTKYFGLAMFLNCVCIFCPSWSQIVRIMLHHHLHLLTNYEIILHPNTFQQNNPTWF
jgi:hypothetical protein